MDFTLVPHVVKEQTIRALRPTATALEAGKLMLDHDISAVIVEDENGDLIGIVTERDLARRVVAAGHNGKDISLEEVMTREPARLSPEDSPFDALELMRDRRIRHVPLVSEGHVVGMVSIRDLRHAIASMPRKKRGFMARLTGAGS